MLQGHCGTSMLLATVNIQVCCIGEECERVMPSTSRMFIDRRKIARFAKPNRVPVPLPVILLQNWKQPVEKVAQSM